MSRAISPNPEPTQAEVVYPNFNPSLGYRNFIERLRLARLERGLSIADISDEVGLTFRLANEFETLVVPLPFDYLEIWCETVGVPFTDFLAIYWADEREWDERKYAQKQSKLNAPCITSTEANAPKTPATELSRPPRNFGWFSPLRAAFACIATFFHSRFSTPKKTLE